MTKLILSHSLQDEQESMARAVEQVCREYRITHICPGSKCDCTMLHRV